MELLKTAAFFLLSFAVVCTISLLVQGMGLKYLGPKIAAFKARTATPEIRRAVADEPSFVDEASVNVEDDVFVPVHSESLTEPTADEVDLPSSNNTDLTGSGLSTKFSHIILDKRINARLFICHRAKPVAELRIGSKRVKQIPFLNDVKLLEMAGHMALKAHHAQAERAA